MGPRAHTIPKVGAGGWVSGGATSDHCFSWLAPDGGRGVAWGSCTLPSPPLRQLDSSRASPCPWPVSPASPAILDPREGPTARVASGSRRVGPRQGSGCASCSPAMEVWGPGTPLGGSALLCHGPEETTPRPWAPGSCPLGLSCLGRVLPGTWGVFVSTYLGSAGGGGTFPLELQTLESSKWEFFGCSAFGMSFQGSEAWPAQTRPCGSSDSGSHPQIWAGPAPPLPSAPQQNPGLEGGNSSSVSRP